MSYRVGFASISGAYVDEHFGSARYWQIYDIKDAEDPDDAVKFVETRKTRARCQGHCEGGFEDTLNILSDCDALFVSRIGQSAAAYMIAHNKRVFEAAGELDEILQQLVETGLLEED
ncbi:MAG: diguanylate cyclase [Oscillospiraceae bacterium]|nr:diguanylate cyclase [Oscillospiraceae bacterium]